MIIYLDHNATSPLDERVRDAMLPYLDCGNPSSVHRMGRSARRAVEAAREQVAAWVGAQPAQVVFTSGGTEANNLALQGVAQALPPGDLLVSAVEHPSVLEPALALQRQGWTRRLLPVDDAGRVEPEGLAEALSETTRLCSIMAANNETGVVQPVSQLAQQVRERGVVMHIDAVQRAGKLPLRLADIGAQLMSLSAHKINGPKGAGALVVDKSVDFWPMLRGGGQERGYRSGTENVAAIVGFGCAAELAAAELEERQRHARTVRDYCIEQLAMVPGVQVLGEAAERLPNTVMFTMAGIDGETTLLHLDRQGIAVSSGSACHSGSPDPSHVLLAMGVAREEAFSAVRASFGAGNERAHVDRLIAALQALRQRMAPLLTEQAAARGVERA